MNSREVTVSNFAKAMARQAKKPIGCTAHDRAWQKARLEHAITVWDRRNRNHHSGAIALLRLDEMMQEVEAGKPIEQAVRENFNDRLLVLMLKELGMQP
jgi:hypothetical protein